MKNVKEATIRLFKAIPIQEENKRWIEKKVFDLTIPKGFIFSSEVILHYRNNEIIELIKIVEKEIGLTGEQMNSSFHKSWKKVKEADIEQLVMEQIIHYITTYGFEELGIYNKDSVYIPNEKLKIPEIDIDGINLVVIKGYTKEELKRELLKLLQTGIALREDTIKDIIDVAIYVKLNAEEIESIKNKEVKVILYDYLDLILANPIEFLRYILYKSTEKTLLIKDKSTIDAIKVKKNVNIIKLFEKYSDKYGLQKLAEIFNRCKPIFLAFKTNSALNTYINKIGKLSKKYHKPMKRDCLNEKTADVKRGNDMFVMDYANELKKANIFRKIRLAYALQYRTKKVSSFLYRIRNGKAFATKTDEYNSEQKEHALHALDIVLDYIVKDIDKNIRGKKIYIPDYITYMLPATEKQFTGNFPSGTYITIPKDMIVGIHWENDDDYRVDLDLSLLSPSTGKIGWDSQYRTEDKSILFSGDITDAPKPKGASELFYIQKQRNEEFIMFVNYYNYLKEVEVPFKIIIAKEKQAYFNKDYMVNSNSILSIAKTKINQKQKILGLLTTTNNECKFYFAETYLGQSITSGNTNFVENSRKYLFNFYSNAISLNEIIERAGGEIIREKENCDVDLSPENLDKNKIIQLLV